MFVALHHPILNITIISLVTSDKQCRTPKYHLMSVFLPTLIDDLWSVVTQDNSVLIRLRFLARYNKS